MVSSCQQDSFTLTGRPVYQINRGCSGGVWGLSAVLANGRVWATTGHAGNLVLDAKTGKTVGKFDSRSTPVIVGGTAFLTWSPGEAPWEVELQATNRVTGAKRWTQEPNGDSGSIVGQPIATNSVVYVATSQGGVFGYRTTTGKLVWSASTGSSFDPSDGGLGKYIPGLAIGGGVLAVPLGNRLTVFRLTLRYRHDQPGRPVLAGSNAPASSAACPTCREHRSPVRHQGRIRLS